MAICGNKLVNKIETEPFCISLSKLAEMLTIVRGWTLLILEVEGQRSRSQWTIWKKYVNPIQTKPLCAVLSNLADM